MNLNLQCRVGRSSIAILISFFVIGLCVFLGTPDRSVSFHYEDAAQRWLHGESLYATSKLTGGGFIYLPQAALIHIPFALVTTATGWEYGGDVLWRLMSWAAFSIAAMSLVSRVCPTNDSATQTDHQSMQWRVALMTSLLGLSCLRIGQSTLLMTALILFSLDNWYRQKWIMCSLIAVLAVCVKPLAVVPLLLYFAITPRTCVPILIFSLLAVVLPLLLQSPTYAWQQYLDCAAMLRTASDAGAASTWAQLFGMCAQLGFEIPISLHNPLRVLAAVMVLAAMIAATRTLSRSRQYLWFFGWTAMYLMLFNPRTENSTYAMVGPLYGLWIGICLVRGKYVAGWTLFALALATMGSYEVGKFFTPEGADATWLAPLCCSWFCVFLIIEFGREMVDARTAVASDYLIYKPGS